MKEMAALRVRAKRAAAVLLCTLMIATGSVRPAQAMSRDVRSVLVIAGYGMVGGTALGLVSLPFSQNVRSVFIGASVGLYLGIAIGIYYVLDRDNGNNPLNPHRRADRGAREAGEELRSLALSRAPTGFETRVDVQAPLRLDVPVLRF